MEIEYDDNNVIEFALVLSFSFMPTIVRTVDSCNPLEVRVFERTFTNQKSLRQVDQISLDQQTGIKFPYFKVKLAALQGFLIKAYLLLKGHLNPKFFNPRLFNHEGGKSALPHAN